MRIKINFKSVLLYAAYSILLLCLNRAAAGAPFSLGLYFSLLICGGNAVASPILYILATAINLDWVSSVLAIFEAGFLLGVTLIYRRAHRKIRAESAAYACIALAPFIAFSRWRGIESLYFTENQYIIRAVAACAVILFLFFCLKSVYALLYRLFRCRLRVDETVCIALTCTVAGVGLYNFCGLYVSLCLSAAIVILSARLCKNPTCTLVACVAGLPPSISTLTPDYLTALVALSVIALLFCRAGRYASGAAGLCACALYFYFTGAFNAGWGVIVVRALLILCCCVATVIPSDKKLNSLYDMLRVKRALPAAEEERFRRAVGDKLYKTSEVFREIEKAFSELDDSPDEPAMRERLFSELISRTCANCKRREKCKKTDVYTGFKRLIISGTVKGKVSLIDLSAEITTNCVEAAEVIAELNKLLSDYRRLSVEAENARSGRALLSDQAKGISQVLKECAVEISRTAEASPEIEKAVERELTAIGVSCPEIKYRGGANAELEVTVVGKVSAATIRQAALRATGRNFMLKDKIVYDTEKCCLIYCVPPPFDAAFGVAYAVKDGGKISGDTHSVIKINEHSFIMALSDGMGSGQYARKVSSTAISLIEAFYRAEMPLDTMLDTINKLLCFNRDERFTCIDVAAIDLNTLKAGFVKIGSPAGLIVRKGEIKVLESHSLPLGILDNLRPTVCEEQLKNGDLVTFMSDGITSAFSTTAELYEFLQTLKPLNPQSLADKILAAAKERAGGVTDDMTVVCVRIFNAHTIDEAEMKALA